MKERVKQIKQQMRQLSSEMAPAQKQLKWLRAELKALAKAGAAVLVLGMMALGALGAETNSVPVVSAEPSTVQVILVNVLYAAAGVLTLLLTWLAALLKKKIQATEVQGKAIDAVTEAVSRTYTDFVRDLKAAGKFDSAAKKQAQEKAIALAKDLAANAEVRAAIVATGASLVEKIVTKLKGGTKLELGVTDATSTVKPA